MFDTLTTKALPWKCGTELISWCPVVNLVAFVSSNGDLALYRVSGQLAWSSPARKGLHIKQVVWRDDGKALGIVYVDGSYQILLVSNGKPQYRSEPSGVTSLRWVTGEPSIDRSDVAHTTLKVLDTVDVLDQMPRLPPLPSGGLLQSRLAFLGGHPTSEQPSSDRSLMIVGTNTGQIDIHLYGIFPIGGVDLYDSDLSPPITNIWPADGAASLGGALARSDQGYTFALYNIGFIDKFGPAYLSQISVIPANIQAIGEYLKQSMQILTKEVVSIKGAFSRFLQSVDPEELKTKLFDLLITGTIPQEVEAWVRDVHESGFRIWHKAALGGYENSRRVLFESILPASERLLVLLSRLYGLASWKERGRALGLTTDTIESAMAINRALIKSVDSCIWALVDELDLFKPFELWMEDVFEEVLDRSVADGKRDKDVKLRTADVSRYLTTYFPSTNLGSFLSSSGDAAKLAATPSKLQQMSLRGLSQQLEEACTFALNSSREVMRSKVSVTTRLWLATNDYNVTQLIATGAEGWFLIYKPDETELLILRLDLKEATASACRISTENFEQDSSSKLVFVKAEFVDKDEVILILKSEDNNSPGRKLVIVNYAQLNYETVSLSSPAGNIAEDARQTLPVQPINSSRVRHFTPNEFEPCDVAINNDPGKRVGCLLHTDQRRYLFFALDEDSADADVNK